MPSTGRLTGTLPLSIAIHIVALMLFLIVPLTSGMELPMLPTKTPSYVVAVAIPVPPPRVASAAPRLPDLQRPVLQEAAPVVAPSQINPESLAPAPATPDLPMGDVSGSAPYLGTVVDNGVRVLTPPAVPRAGTPVRVSDLVRAPTKVVDVRPAYPSAARQARIQGTVILEAILDRDGRIDRLKVVRSVPLLDAAALEAVRQWRYTPTVLNGQPVAVLMTITIHFTLQ